MFPVHHFHKTKFDFAVFLEKVEEQVSKEAIERFYEMVKPINGKRWYDKDPVISKTVEILRVVPPEVQNACAERFIAALKEMGLSESIRGEALTLEQFAQLSNILDK